MDNSSPSFGHYGGTLLQERLAVIVGWTSSYRRTNDPEALHQLRVAVRRIRTVLDLFGADLGPGAVETKRAFRSLSEELGTVRDLDVVLAQLTQWRAAAPPQDEAKFAPIEAGLRAAADAARFSLASTLDSQPYRALLDGAAALMAEPTSASEASMVPDVSVRKLARVLLARRWRKMRRSENKLRLGTPAAALHRLRIHNKRLRDALQCFVDLFPERVAEAWPRLQQLHDDLGAHQDAELALRWLNSRTNEDMETGAALKWLKRRIERKKRKTRARSRHSFRRVSRLDWDWLRPIERLDLPTAGAYLPTSTTKRPAEEVLMQDLYIIRHAVAFERDPAEWPDDQLRPLTPGGRRRWRKAARGLGRLAPRTQVLLSSTWVRGWETAKILCDAGGWPAPMECRALEDDNPEAVLNAIRPHLPSGAAAVVGHEPFLHRLVSYLLTGDPDRVNVAFRKGGCARLRVPETLPPGAAQLDWLLPPGTLRAMAGKGG